MHPLKTHLLSLERGASDRQDYLGRMELLARVVGVSPKIFHRIHNPNQNATIAVSKSLRMELATLGMVPAESTSREAEEVIQLARQVIKQRDAIAQKNTEERNQHGPNTVSKA